MGRPRIRSAIRFRWICEVPAAIVYCRDQRNSRTISETGKPPLATRLMYLAFDWLEFVLPANGFEDFGRAIRQKFVIEVSGAPLTGVETKFGQLDRERPSTIR